MPALDNARYETFAKGIFEGMTQADAYRKAFPKSKRWKPKTLYSRASELAKDSNVLGRIEELKDEAATALIMAVRERKVTLSNIASKSRNEKMQISAIDTLNKMDGLYNFPKQIDATVHGDIGEAAAKISEILSEEDT